MNKPLSPDLIQKMDSYWRAANYLSVGQIYREWTEHGGVRRFSGAC